MKKIAIPCSGDNMVSRHFGHCKTFEVYTVSDNNEIEKKESLTPPPHAPGLLPKWLKELQVNLVLAGGIGGNAIALFNQSKIEVIAGVPDLTVDDALKAYLSNKLVLTENGCSH